jgi:hypothetical protein
MQIKKIGELEIIDKMEVSTIFNLKIDLINKLLYFIENNGTNEPTLCLSLDVLSPDPISKIIINSNLE